MLELEGLGAIAEYNNSGALIGLDGPDGEELLGALNDMNPLKRFQVMNRLAGGNTPSKGSRAEMEKHFSELPSHIKDGLKKGELRLADTVIYSRKIVNSKTVKMFETQDVKAIGMRNISNAKLPKNQALLVSGIIILAATVSPGTGGLIDDNVISTAFSKIEDYAPIANGEFTLKANKKIIMTDVDMAIFKTGNNTSLPYGYYKLANPRIIQDDVLIEATIELGSLTGIDTSKVHLYIGLHGTITTP